MCRAATRSKKTAPCARLAPNWSSTARIFRRRAKKRFAAGTVVTTETSNTRADGMATRIPDADAVDIIRKGASRIVQVTDDEVGAAIRAYWTDTHNLAEGAGA